MIFIFLPLLAILAVYVYVWYRFLRTLRDTLRAVSERNRAMRPDLVWLNFIPLFGLVWMFVTVLKIRDSARAEFAFRGLKIREDTGYGSGMAFAVTSVLSETYVPWERLTNEAAIVALTIVTWVVGVASFITWLVFWEQASRLRGLLLTAAPATGSPAAPNTRPGYQLRSWEVPVEPQQASVAAEPAAPWLGASGAQTQPGPWLGGRGPQSQTAGPVLCPNCGAVYRSDAAYCSSCGRSAV